jgi:hypothetical protein
VGDVGRENAPPNGTGRFLVNRAHQNFEEQCHFTEIYAWLWDAESCPAKMQRLK